MKDGIYDYEYKQLNYSSNEVLDAEAKLIIKGGLITLKLYSEIYGDEVYFARVDSSSKKGIYHFHAEDDVFYRLDLISKGSLIQKNSKEVEMDFIGIIQEDGLIIELRLVEKES